MDDIPRSVSFLVDHLKMECGIYVPLVEKIGNVTVTTFDIRVCRPYRDPVLSEGESHTIEHMLATGLRAINNPNIRVLYFGPMGCMTGFYLLLAGTFSSMEAAAFIRQGTENALKMNDVPANNQMQCGNCFSLLPVEKVRLILEKILSFCIDSEKRGSFSEYDHIKMNVSE